MGRLDTSFFNALQNDVRIKIMLTFLEKQQPMSVNEIASKFSIDLSNISRHLKILRDAELLRKTKVGKSVYYEFNQRQTLQILSSLVQLIESLEFETLTEFFKKQGIAWEEKWHKQPVL